jgi:hypothetical protein
MFFPDRSQVNLLHEAMPLAPVKKLDFLCVDLEDERVSQLALGSTLAKAGIPGAQECDSLFQLFSFSNSGVTNQQDTPPFTWRLSIVFEKERDLPVSGYFGNLGRILAR